MDCKEYYNIRNQIKNGDVILYKGKNIISKLIRFFDKSYYDHCGIITTISGRFFTIDIINSSYHFVPLSRRMKQYEEFCILRSVNKNHEQISNAVNFIVDKFERDIKFDILFFLKTLFFKRTGIDLFRVERKNRIICSKLCQYFFAKLDISTYKTCNLISPQDFIRLINDDEVDLLFDLSPKI
jgi:hypothetical protein